MTSGKAVAGVVALGVLALGGGAYAFNRMEASAIEVLEEYEEYEIYEAYNSIETNLNYAKYHLVPHTDDDNNTNWPDPLNVKRTLGYNYAWYDNTPEAEHDLLGLESRTMDAQSTLHDKNNVGSVNGVRVNQNTYAREYWIVEHMREDVEIMQDEYYHMLPDEITRKASIGATGRDICLVVGALWTFFGVPMTIMGWGIP